MAAPVLGPRRHRKSAAVRAGTCEFWIKYYPPVTEQELVEKALQRIAGALPDQGHRDLLKELLDQGLERAVQRLKEYTQFQPGRFSLQEVNDRLVRFCPYGRAS